jgi:hypothetical protein
MPLCMCSVYKLPFFSNPLLSKSIFSNTFSWDCFIFLLLLSSYPSVLAMDSQGTPGSKSLVSVVLILHHPVTQSHPANSSTVPSDPQFCAQPHSVR